VSRFRFWGETKLAIHHTVKEMDMSKDKSKDNQKSESQPQQRDPGKEIIAREIAAVLIAATTGVVVW
tara:strand:+ start:93 stop:293 length:201 start_codon:yes stop_codon:yes gene_type:complete